MGWWRLGPGGGIGIPGVDAIPGLFGGDDPADEMETVRDVLAVLLEGHPKPTVGDICGWLVDRQRLNAVFTPINPDVLDFLATQTRLAITNLYIQEFERPVNREEMVGIVQFVFGGCEDPDNNFWEISHVARAQTREFLDRFANEVD